MLYIYKKFKSSYQKFIKDPHNKKIFTNIYWLFNDKFIKLTGGIFVSVFIARYFGPSQLGILSFASATVAIFSSFVMLGLKHIVIRNIIKKKSVTNVMLGTTALLQSIAGIFSYILILLLINYTSDIDETTKSILFILALTLLFHFTEIAELWCESQLKIKYIVWIKNFFYLIFIIIKIVSIHNSVTIKTFALIMAGETFFVGLVFLIFLSKEGFYFLKLKVSLSIAKKLLKDSWPYIISGLAITIYMKIDQVMISQMLDMKSVGIYSIAVKIVEVFFFISVAISSSFYPSIIKAKSQSTEKYNLKLQQLFDLMSIISLVIIISTTIFSEFVILKLFGQQYAESSSVIKIHVWSVVFVYLGVVSGKWLLTENYNILSMQRTILGAFINVLLNFYLIPVFGINGAAFSTVISYAIVGLFFDLFFKKTRKIFSMKINSLNIYSLIIRNIKFIERY